ncbi:serine/threonine-protein kinase [Humidisolicoccus flavus]|uniref:serine/threonine-protein kinase n=1 Tax=Humidisolicoccus flavus TaxID=3111414 RepID=UPI00324C0047
MAKRAPSPAPRIPGYDYQEHLGSGGFADVFLYQQLMPARQVAVKVLLPDAVDRNLIEEFRTEANVMAQLSSHPSIVTVYGADISADGRPFLTMEYCPKANLGARYRKDRFSIPEVLRLGIQIAGAVETAHRAGILHRDIKPANILTTAYNRPALTDFGIATTINDHASNQGMSIPWSPPEAFMDVPWSGRESDVFSLAATLYTLLAGRTPFEVPGGGNSSIDLISRIQRGELPPLARSDAPNSLQSVLSVAMDVNPRRRYGSAMAFGRALQQVELELHLPMTPLDVLDDSIARDEIAEDDDGATRIRGVVIVDPHRDDQKEMGRLLDRPEADDRTIRRAEGYVGGVTQHAEPQGQGEYEDEPRKKMGAKGVIAIIAAAVLVLVTGGIFLAFTQPWDNPTVEPTQSSIPIDNGNQPPNPPIGVNGVVEGDEVTFTWVNPQPLEGDTYLYRLGTNSAVTKISDAQVVVPKSDSGETCIFVAVVRDSGRESQYTSGCVTE